ncbi:MAG TPA: metallophosphoesterase, partial [Spirochaetia bacterium]|nr:metallophosphoesterase [Spirochaetia bacterium]
MKKKLHPWQAVACFLFLFSCTTTPPSVITHNQTSHPPAAYPEVTFGVFSDPHLSPAALGTIGPAFREEVRRGQKLIHVSEEILTRVIDILAADPDCQFVLIPGDLTRDGERVGHERMVELLGRLQQSGKKVYVVPGNHDILNYNACRFTAQGSTPVPSVTPEEFRALYLNFGYGEALAEDPHSLSYVAEPVPGLWLFGLDSCTYERNSPSLPTSTGGRFSPETFGWIEHELMEARRLGKTVIGFMHH